MKCLVFLGMFCCIAAGINAQTSTNPCLDSIFMALKQKPTEQMTDGEYAYFQQKDLDCNNFQLLAKQDREKLKERDQPKQARGNTVAWIVGVSLGLSIALIIFTFPK